MKKADLERSAFYYWIYLRPAILAGAILRMLLFALPGLAPATTVGVVEDMQADFLALLHGVCPFRMNIGRMIMG